MSGLHFYILSIIQIKTKMLIVNVCLNVDLIAEFNPLISKQIVKIVEIP